MNCTQCPHYKCGYMWNRCDVTDSENFRPRQDCDAVDNNREIRLELYKEVLYSQEIEDEK